LCNGTSAETKKIASRAEPDVEAIADHVLSALGIDSSLKTYVPDRPGHDRRYLLNSSKIRNELGWKPMVPTEQGLKNTVLWYKESESWWKPLLERLTVQEANWK